MSTVGVVGLGAMGGAFARRLLEADHEVLGYDVDDGAVRQAEEHGVNPGSLDRIAECEIVCTSLPDDPVVRSVLTGPDGFLARMRPDSTLIEFSTILPETMHAVREAGSEHGINLIDCPISGGPNEVLDGSLVLLVGAPEDTLNEFHSFLEHLGTVQHVGDIGAGKAIKLVNNIMSMGNVLLAAEAFVLGAKAGLDPDRMFEVLSGSGGRSHHLKKRFPYALAGDFQPFFSIKNAEKDLRTGLRFADNNDAPMMATSVIHEMYKAAKTREFSGEDMVAVLKLYEEWAGVRVRGEKNAPS